MTPYYDDGAGIQLFLGDNRAILPTLDAGSVDLILTDPPYNVSVDGADLTGLTFRRPGQAEGRRDFGAWDYGFDPAPLAALFDTVPGPNGQLYTFCSEALLGMWWLACEGRFPRRQILGWNKPDPVPSIRQRCWCSATEYVLWAARGRYTFNYHGHVAMYQWQQMQAPKHHRLHPTQKPLALVAKYLAASTNPGDLVIDPFAGSGTTLVAAKGLGRRAIGIELSEHYAEIAVKRLAQQVLPLGMVAD